MELCRYIRHTGREGGQVAGNDGRTAHQSRLRGFAGKVGSGTAWARQIHVRLDNLSAHKTKGIKLFLAAHPKVRFHFKPTYSSWLNQVELWFAKTQRGRDCARRLHFEGGSGQEAAEIHPRLLEISTAIAPDLQ